MTPPTDDPAPQCAVCHLPAPAARPFCGWCGAAAGAPVTLPRTLLRPTVFAAAPREPILLPLVTSSLFTRLSEASRKPFRLGLFLVLATLVVFPLLRLHGPSVVMAALGVPLLFVIYLWQSDAFRDIPARALVIAAVLGAGLGAAWWWWAGVFVARAFDISLAAGAQLQRALNIGMPITTVGALLMLLPAVVVRLLRITSRESLDGFAVGALGALSYTAAGTLTWMGPQFTAGLLANYSPGRLIEETMLYGVVDPLTAAAAGGLVGLELWFRPSSRTSRHPKRLRAALAVMPAVVLAIYLAVFLVDAMQYPRATELGLNLVLTALALLTLRFSVQMALLHELTDTPGDSPVPCLHCDHLVPDMPYCPDCGAAARASSRTWRRARATAAGPRAN